GGSLAPVAILEADDVGEVVRRDLDDEGVLDGRDAMHRSRAEAIRVAGRDLERLEGSSDLPQLEVRSPLLDEPGLVLDLVVLQAQRLAGPDEEQLADVVVRLGPDELPAPRLLDLPRRGRIRVHEKRSASSGMCCPAPTRRPWSRTFPPPTRAPGPTTERLC